MKHPPPSQQHRPEDTGYNNPSKAPLDYRNVHRHELAPLEPDDEWPESAADPDAKIPPAGEAIRKTRRFFRTAVFVLSAAAALLLLFLYAAALDFYSRASEYPLVLQLPVWLLLALVLGIACYATWRCFRLWLSLRSHPQVALEQTTLEDQGRARDELTRYLKDLIRDPAALGARWERFWPEDETGRDRLIRACRDLVAERPIETDAWLEEFDRHVRKPMDRIARARVRYYWRLVGIKTAISPFPIIDAIAVLYNNFLLIGDIASLYGRRIERYEALILLGLIVFQIYIATQAQEALESGAEEISQSIQSGMASSFTRIFSPKIAEGTIHALVTWRIGKRAIRTMSPIRPSRK